MTLSHRCRNRTRTFVLEVALCSLFFLLKPVRCFTHSNKPAFSSIHWREEHGRIRLHIFPGRQPTPAPQDDEEKQLSTSYQLNDDQAKEEEKNDEDDGDDDDFSNWVKGLGQWPLAPSSPSTSQQFEDNNDEQDSMITLEKNFFLNPLLSLINMEVLLGGNQSEVDANGVQKGVKSDSDVPVNPFGSVVDFNRSALALSNTSEAERSQPWTMMSALEELSAWNKWVGSIPNTAPTSPTDTTTSSSLSKSAEGIWKQASARVESVLADASAVLSSSNSVQSLIVRASQTVQNTKAASDLMSAARQIAQQTGLDIAEAAERARRTTAYAANLLAVANDVLRNGYVAGDGVQDQELLESVPEVEESKALFADYVSVRELKGTNPLIMKASEMAFLSGAIYEETIPRTLGIGHSIVARGVSDDVAWMVTDSIANRSAFYQKSAIFFERKTNEESLFVRAFTVRGFDATDEEVDRERLVYKVCTASPTTLKSQKNVLIHSGLLGIARSVYMDIKQYIDWTPPSHKIVLNGHSLGGSVAFLVLLLMTEEYGSEFVRDRVLRVYMFGSPPVVALKESPKYMVRLHGCDVLEAFDLPSAMVHGYVQPWDPIVRLFTNIDPLYPLAGDLGSDGVTPWVSGPPRTLRPIVKAIVEAWEGWPPFRDNYVSVGSQNYISAGVQHILLPDPTRYLTDRFIAVNIPVPPIEAIVQISSRELLPALNALFPLDTFEISFVPQCIRSFVHHFYPAYGFPFVDYVKRVEKKSRLLPDSQRTSKSSGEVAQSLSGESDIESEKVLKRATQWLPAVDSILDPSISQKP